MSQINLPEYLASSPCNNFFLLAGPYKYSDSPYCITPDSSVVRAFAQYGWGWGGGDADNNYSGWNTTADYMHFSILESGG